LGSHHRLRARRDQGSAGQFRAIELAELLGIQLRGDVLVNFDLPDGGLGPVGAEELRRAACAVMAFGFAEVITVDQVLGRLPVAASA
jgi:hypothetical protein